MDWIKQGKQLLHYLEPPKTPTDDEIETFKDGLKQLVPKKLEEVNARLDYLKRKRDAKLRIIRRKTKKGSAEEHFCVLYAEYEYSEADCIEKWIAYWTSILERVTGKKPEVETTRNKISKADIERAKEHPLENLYQGNLKRAGSRLTGLCPLHEEKTPSFFIFPDNHFHCYGCGEHGNSITFVMKVQNLAFLEAVGSLK